MEDVLSISTRPYDPRSPQICMDESAKQLLKDKRERLPAQPGQPERVDYTFEAAGMCKLFLACEPLAGRRQVKVTERRTRQDSCLSFCNTTRFYALNFFSTPLSSTALVATVIELALMAKAPTSGLSRIPRGYSTPAATGMAITL